MRVRPFWSSPTRRLPPRESGVGLGVGWSRGPAVTTPAGLPQLARLIQVAQTAANAPLRTQKAHACASFFTARSPCGSTHGADRDGLNHTIVSSSLAHRPIFVSPNSRTLPPHHNVWWG